MNKKIVLPNLVSDRIALLGSYKTLCSIVFKQLMNLTFFCIRTAYIACPFGFSYSHLIHMLAIKEMQMKVIKD